MVSYCGVGSTLASASRGTPPALSRSGFGHQSREVRAGAFQHDSVSWGAGRHRTREGLPIGLSDCRISGFGGHVPPPLCFSCNIVVAAADSASVGGFSRGDGPWKCLSMCCSSSPPLFQCVDDQVGHLSSSSLNSGSLILGGEGALHKHFRDEGSSACLNTSLPRIVRDLAVLVSDSTTVVTYLRKQVGTVSRVVCSLAQGIVA